MSTVTPLVKYIPRICQDDGMIEQAELAHYTHLAGLKTYYLTADVDALLRQREEEVEKLKHLADSQEFRAEQAEGKMHERYDLWQQVSAQLAASQARCAQLEEALKDIAGYAGENGCCPYGCDTPDIAKRALTLTERPPA